MRYQALFRFLKIDSNAPDALEQLRSFSDHAVAAATYAIEDGQEFTF